MSMEFELKIIEFLQAGRTPFFDMAFQVLSQVGTVVGVVFVCIFFLIFKRRLCFWFLFSYGFVNLTVNIFKEVVQRVRPYNVSDAIISIGDTVKDFSFPSGHTACATAIAIFVGYFLWTTLKSRGQKITSVVCCCMFVALVGLSRMYLGKHYLTDLIGGFAISAFFCTLGLVFMHFYDKQRLQRQKERQNENKDGNF